MNALKIRKEAIDIMVETINEFIFNIFPLAAGLFAIVVADVVTACT